MLPDKRLFRAAAVESTAMNNHPILDWKAPLQGRKRVVVGMSGGVDSSVTAWRLKEAGLEVIGLFMKNWEDDDDDEYCSTRQDFLDAVAAAETIGIDIQAVNFAAEYKDRVFADFLREYQAGRTPNPDVLCNAEIKFKAFLDHAMTTGADCIATGHYAQLQVTPRGSYELVRAADASKDQTYFLHRLNQSQLARTIFPIGDLPKTKVREIAQSIGLANAAKKDSTGICFIGERPFRDFLNRYLPTSPGPMKTPSGRTVGQHMGLAFYTLGQRKGLGIGGEKAGDGNPWFVIRKDLPNNTLIVDQGHDAPGLLSQTLSAIDAAWVSGHAPEDDGQISAKTRYRQPDAACHLRSVDGATFALDFDEAQWAVTPGQSAVVYRGPVCLGGGIIS
jgi:tRNA-specific 2-thiouridylase